MRVSLAHCARYRHRLAVILVGWSAAGPCKRCYLTAGVGCISAVFECGTALLAYLWQLIMLLCPAIVELSTLLKQYRTR